MSDSAQRGWGRSGRITSRGMHGNVHAMQQTDDDEADHPTGYPNHPIARTKSNELRKNSNADIHVYYPM